MSVKSSRTVFRVLRVLAAEPRPVGAADLAKSLDVPVTTAARALATLEAAGYAERHQGASRYVIGKSARTLAFAFMAQFPVRDLAMPYLQQLTLESGSTSSLFVRLGWFAVRIASILGPGVLIHRTSLGEALPLTQGAPSRAMLAHLRGDEFDRVLERTALEGAEHAGEAARVRTACAAIREVGVALEPSPSAPNTVDVAAALPDHHDRVIAAVAVEGVARRNLADLMRPEASARQVMRDLAEKIRGEHALTLSHYDHVDPDGIAF